MSATTSGTWESRGPEVRPLRAVLFDVDTPCWTLVAHGLSPSTGVSPRSGPTPRPQQWGCAGSACPSRRSMRSAAGPRVGVSHRQPESSTRRRPAHSNVGFGCFLASRRCAARRLHGAWGHHEQVPRHGGAGIRARRDRGSVLRRRRGLGAREEARARSCPPGIPRPRVDAAEGVVVAGTKVDILAGREAAAVTVGVT